MGRVMVVAIPVQGSKATKPDMAIKAIRVVIINSPVRGDQQQQSGYQSNPKQLNSGQYHVFTTSLCKRDQKLHKMLLSR